VRNVTWLISYPRSGNTWMRLLLGAILSPKNVSYKKIDELLPDTHQRLSYFLKRFREKKDLPFLVFKSHSIYPRGVERGDKFIYLYRDPRDVALSEYYYRQWERGVEKKPPIKDFTTFLKEQFVKGGDYGTWRIHVLFWTQKTDKANLVIRYEDLYEHTEDVLSSVLEVLGYIPTKEEVRRAVELTSFNRCIEMAEKEEVHTLKRGLKGRPGRWKEEMNEEQLEIIKSFCGDVMEMLGYDWEV